MCTASFFFIKSILLFLNENKFIDPDNNKNV